MTRTLPLRDGLAAALLAGYAAFEVLSGLAPGVGEVPGRVEISAPAAVVSAAAIALRRRPVAGLALSIAALVVEGALTESAEGLAPLVAQLLLVYSLAARTSAWTAVTGLVLTVAVLGTVVGDPVFLLVVYAVPWLAGRVLGERQRQLADLQVRSVEGTAQAVTDERARIARELHDVVSHALTLVVVQAQVAQATVRTDPSAAESALVSVKEAAQTALADMRRMLGVLSDNPAEDLLPQPGLHDLPSLLDRVRGAGLDVVVHEDGAPRQLPAGASLTAYRVLQEGLTNALRHGTTGRARLQVTWSDREVVLCVSNDGVAAPARAHRGTGHGLVGLRERVALYGGTLRAGPGPRGGYVLEAVLPA